MNNVIPVWSILDQLSATNSTIDKQNILRLYSDHDLLKKVFFFAYDPQINFFIKKIPEFVYDGSESVNLSDAIDLIFSKLSSREITGNAARDFLSSILSKMPLGDSDVLTRVVAKDMKCGVTATTVNKIWPGLIPQMKVMLASSDLTKIRFPAIAQPKMDGLRAHFTLRENDVLIRTRNGNVVDDGGFFHKPALELMRTGETWDGEIVCINKETGAYLSRKESNGILNKAIRGTISDKEIQQMRAVVWDIPSLRESYYNRLHELFQRFETESFGIFRIIESNMVNSFDEVGVLYDDQIRMGHEGLVVKDPNAFWEGKRSNSIVKMKEILDCDLQVIGWEEGTGKNKGRMGNLICSTSDGLLVTSVGTGFSDKQREEFTEDFVMNKIAALKYNEIIKAKNSDTYSLFLPRFIEFRDDKDEADPIGSFMK